MRLAVPLVAVVILLGACGGSDQAPSSAGGPSSAAPSSSPSESATYEPSYAFPTEESEAIVEIGCWTRSGNSVVVGDKITLTLFWDRHFDDCSETTASGVLSEQEQKALEEAYRSTRVKSLGTLYGMCAENDARWLTYLKTGSPSQIREAKGALILCPEHPQASKVKGYIRAGLAEQELVEQGRVFYDGTYRVGRKVPPGTYFDETWRRRLLLGADRRWRQHHRQQLH